MDERTFTAIQQYIISGIPERAIPALMKELNLNEEKFKEYMRGQTALLVGDEVIYYTCDIINFIEGNPVFD